MYKSLLKEIESNKDSFSIGTILIPFDEKVQIKLKTYINTVKTVFLCCFRSSFPYKKIGILVSDDFSDNSPVNVAFDLASTLSADVTALNILTKFLQPEHTSASNKNTERIQDLALSNEVQCEIVNAEGNEAKVFSSFTDKIDLSIVSQTSQSNWQGKKIAEFILQNAKSSVLYMQLMENFDALSLVIISLGAFLLPLIAQRISIPSIVLEIAYGILVGPVLGIVKISEFISGLAIFGFMLLMFLSGFEIELDTFREKGLKTLSIPLAIYIATVATSFYLITLDYPIFLALVLCTTSVDIVITVLRSDDTIKTNYGQSLYVCFDS